MQTERILVSIEQWRKSRVVRWGLALASFLMLAMTCIYARTAWLGKAKSRDAFGEGTSWDGRYGIRTVELPEQLHDSLSIGSPVFLETEAPSRLVKVGEVISADGRSRRLAFQRTKAASLPALLESTHSIEFVTPRDEEQRLQAGLQSILTNRRSGQIAADIGRLGSFLKSVGERAWENFFEKLKKRKPLAGYFGGANLDDTFRQLKEDARVSLSRALGSESVGSALARRIINGDRDSQTLGLQAVLRRYFVKSKGEASSKLLKRGEAFTDGVYLLGRQLYNEDSQDQWILIRRADSARGSQLIMDLNGRNDPLHQLADRILDALKSCSGVVTK